MNSLLRILLVLPFAALLTASGPPPSFGEVPILRPIASIGGGIGSLIPHDEGRVWAALGEGVALIDASDPERIVAQSGVSLGAQIYRIVRNGDYLNVLTHSRKGFIVDISDPDSPRSVREIPFAQMPSDLFIQGSHGYLVEGSRVRLIDYSKPAEPNPVGEFDLGVWPTFVSVQGNFGYLGVQREGLRVYDLSDPSNPKEVARWPVQKDVVSFGMAGHIGVIGERRMGIHLVDFSNPASPKKVGYIEDQSVDLQLTVSGNLLLAPSRAVDLTLYDISDPSAPTKIAQIDSPGEGGEALLVDDRLYLVSEGLKVYDLSDPKSAKLLGRFKTLFNPKALHFHSGFAYVIGQSSELTLVDCRVHESIGVVGEVDLGEIPNCLSGYGSHLYVFGKGQGLQVYDIKSPDRPTLLRKDSRFQGVDTIVVGESRAVVTGRDGLHVLDLSDPFRPESVGSYDPIQTGSGRPALLDRHLFIPTGNLGVQIVDLKHPTSPVFRTLIDHTTDPFGVALAGNRLILSGNQAPMSLYDVSDPTKPVKIGALEDKSQGVIGTESSFITVGYQGGAEFDLSNPNEVKKTRLFEGGLNHSALLANRLLFDPAWSKGLRIFDLDEGENP